MDKKKVMIASGVVIAGGAILLSQKGKDTPLGKMGSVISAPIESFTGGEDTGIGDKDNASIIPELMGMMPQVGEGGDMLPWTPDPSALGYDAGDEPAVIKKSRLPGLFSAAGAGIGGTARIGATGVMLPTQILGGSVAKVADAGIKWAMGSGYQRRLIPAQRARTKKYPRAASAVSMITGGVTARPSAPSKKQAAARKKYPRVYKAWQSVFKYVGA